MTEHPSYLELDRHALGAGLDTNTARHVANCALCQAHLERILAESVVPVWVEQLAAAAPARTHDWRPWTAALGGLAAAAVLCLVWLRPSERPLGYDTAKGMPAVGVYVNRHEVVRVWDGAALEPGDRIRLEVAPEEFAHVSVFLEGEGSATPLYQGPVQAHARSVLPKAWQLDATSSAERIVVLFSDRTLAPAEAEAQLRRPDPKRACVVRLTLPKRLP